MDKFWEHAKRYELEFGSGVKGSVISAAVITLALGAGDKISQSQITDEHPEYRSLDVWSSDPNRDIRVRPTQNFDLPWLHKQQMYKGIFVHHLFFLGDLHKDFSKLNLEAIEQAVSDFVEKLKVELMGRGVEITSVRAFVLQSEESGEDA